MRTIEILISAYKWLAPFVVDVKFKKKTLLDGQDAMRNAVW